MDRIILLLHSFSLCIVIVNGASTTHTDTTTVPITPLNTSTANDTLNTTVTDTVPTKTTILESLPTETTTQSKPTTTISTQKPGDAQTTVNPSYEGALTEAEELSIIVVAVVCGTAVVIVLVALMSRYFLTSKTLSQEQKQKFNQESFSNGVPKIHIEMSDFDNTQIDSKLPSTSSGSR